MKVKYPAISIEEIILNGTSHLTSQLDKH